jgi:hypothetical protein
VTLRRLLWACETGALDRDTRLCWRKGFAEWVPIEAVPECADGLIVMRARYDAAQRRRRDEVDAAATAAQAVGSGAVGATALAQACVIL